MDNDNKNKCNSLASKLFSLQEFKLTEENLSLSLRSNSCLIPSIIDLAYCLDFVPKLK